MKKTWLITGCSTGLGRALAEILIDSGHNVVPTARDIHSIDDLARGASKRVLPLELDVTDAVQRAAVVQAAQDRFGDIDVLVNNAGYGYRSAIEEGEDDAVRALFETQFFAGVALIKAVLPKMRGRRSGAIVNFSSIAATARPVGAGYYAAVKSAIEGMSDSLRGELHPLGISVTIVEPGGFRTDFAGRSLQQTPTIIADYADTAGKRRKENDTADGTQPGEPMKAALAIVKAVESDQPPAFLLLGSDALDTYRAVAAARAIEIDAWEPVTAHTGFDSPS